jgi:hypothetical protein
MTTPAHTRPSTVDTRTRCAATCGPADRLARPATLLRGAAPHTPTPTTPPAGQARCGRRGWHPPRARLTGCQPGNPGPDPDTPCSAARGPRRRRESVPAGPTDSTADTTTPCSPGSRRPCCRRAPGLGGTTDRGSVTVLAAVLILALIAALALVVDGAGKLRAINRADAIAAEAGRAALTAVDTRGPAPRLDTPAAVHAANAYLTRVGHPGSVTLTLTEPAAIPLFGASYTVTGHASAELGVGVHSRSQ